MAGTVISTGSIPKALWPGLKALFGTTYDQHPMTYPKLFTKVSSDKAYEEYLPFTGFGMAQIKPQGQSVSFDGQQQGNPTRLTNTTWGLGYIVTMEEIEDVQYVKVSESRTRALAFSMVQAKEVNMHLVYNRAFNATYVGADGVALCSTAHLLWGGGTWANTPAVPADLSEASLEDALIAIKGFTDDKGLQINCRATSLVVPRQEEFNAARILRSSYQSGTANNDINAMKEMGSIPEVVVSTYLTSPHSWFVRTDCGGDSSTGLIYQERKAPSFNQDNEFDTLNFKAMCYERYAGGWADPRAIWGVQGP